MGVGFKGVGLDGWPLLIFIIFLFIVGVYAFSRGISALNASTGRENDYAISQVVFSILLILLAAGLFYFYYIAKGQLPSNPFGLIAMSATLI